MENFIFHKEMMNRSVWGGKGKHLKTAGTKVLSPYDLLITKMKKNLPKQKK